MSEIPRLPNFIFHAGRLAAGTARVVLLGSDPRGVKAAHDCYLALQVTTGTLRLTPCASVTQFALHSRRTRHQARLLQSWRLLVRACARVCLEMMMLVPTAGLSVLLQQHLAVSAISPVL